MYKSFRPARRDRGRFGLPRRRQSCAPVWGGPPLRPSWRPGHQGCPLRPRRSFRLRCLRWPLCFAVDSSCRQRTAGAGRLPRPTGTAMLPGLPPYALRAGRSGCGSTAVGYRPQESQEPSLRGRAYARSLLSPNGPSTLCPARAVSAGESRSPHKPHPSTRISRRRGPPAGSPALAALLTSRPTPPGREQSGAIHVGQGAAALAAAGACALE